MWCALVHVTMESPICNIFFLYFGPCHPRERIMNILLKKLKSLGKIVWDNHMSYKEIAHQSRYLYILPVGLLQLCYMVLVQQSIKVI